MFLLSLSSPGAGSFYTMYAAERLTTYSFKELKYLPSLGGKFPIKIALTWGALQG